MFIRVKTKPGSLRKAVQLVESVREGKKVRQRIVRHVGVAETEAELEKLKELGETIKVGLRCERQQPLLPRKKLVRLAIEARREKARKGPPVAIEQIREERRITTGFHEAYGAVYRQLGFDGLLPAGKNRSARETLEHMVAARIANPDSKRGTARRLESELGVSIPVQKIYRMMDRLDKDAIESMKDLAADAARKLLPEPASVVFFDCTTLHFESVEADGLREFGFSKNGRHGRIQVLLALMVGPDGLPFGYEVFPGSEYEGKSLIPSLERMREREGIRQAVHVADRRKAVEKLKLKLRRSANPAQALSSRGFGRFIKVEGDARLEVDEDKIKEAARWDGLKGIATNASGMEHAELFARYRELWRVEESFRITKHDLKVRPVFHWKPDRVKAHIAIAYMAFACVRHLTYRIALQQRERMSPQRIRTALAARQCSIMRDTASNRRFAVPSTTTPDMDRICRTLGLPMSRTPYWIE